MPYIDVDIEEEDSLDFRRGRTKYYNDKINISILKLKNLSNFTDLSPLKIIQDVNINYVEPCDIDDSTDLLIIPASKNVIDDIRYMDGLKNIVSFSKCGNIIAIGNAVEYLSDEIVHDGIITKGLGIFDAKVQHCEEIIIKKNITFEKKENLLSNVDEKLEMNYVKSSDIHTNDVLYEDDDGVIALQKDNTFAFCGYGIFENTRFINQILNNIRLKKNMQDKAEIVDFSVYREEQIKKLSMEFEKYVDIKKLEEIIENGL